MDSTTEFDEFQLLADICRDILARPDAYRDGESFLREQYGPERLHQEAMASWKQSGEDPIERPKLEEWTPTACAYQAIQGLRKAPKTLHDTRAKAILLLAVMLWDPDADTLHPIFSVFGSWGVTPAGEIEEVSRWSATYFVHDPAEAQEWMMTVSKAWTKLQRLARANGPGAKKPDRTYSIAEVLEMADISNTTLSRYAKRAGIKTPGRGKRNHQYSDDEVRKVLQEIIDNTSDRATKKHCRDSLAKL